MDMQEFDVQEYEMLREEYEAMPSEPTDEVANALESTRQMLDTGELPAPKLTNEEAETLANLLMKVEFGGYPGMAQPDSHEGDVAYRLLESVFGVGGSAWPRDWPS